MKKLLLMGFAVLLIASYSYAGETFILKAQTEDTDRDFLELFTEEEQCIILSFEHQLDTFAMIYSYHHKGPVATTNSSVSLWGVGSLYYNSSDKTLEGFLDYLCKPIIEKVANIGINVVSFKDRVRKDYEFVKCEQAKKAEEEKKLAELKIKQQQEEEFFNDAMLLYNAFKSSSQGRRIMDKARERAKELIRGDYEH